MPIGAQHVQQIVLTLVMCHLVGDYVLQGQFIAETKGKNSYHMFIHCTLYCLPFMVILSGWQLVLLYCSHVIIDLSKAKYNKITYEQDQCLHYLVLFLLGFFIV